MSRESTIGYSNPPSPFQPHGRPHGQPRLGRRPRNRPLSGLTANQSTARTWPSFSFVSVASKDRPQPRPCRQPGGRPQMGGAITILGRASERALAAVSSTSGSGIDVLYKRCPGRARNSFDIPLILLARFPALPSGVPQWPPRHMSGAVELVPMEDCSCYLQCLA